MMVFNILSSQLVNAFRTKNEFFSVEVRSSIDGKNGRGVESAHLESGQEVEHVLVVQV